MSSHSLTNFEIQRYYQNQRKLSGVYLGKRLPKTKDGTYVINLNKYKLIGTQWIILYVNSNCLHDSKIKS